MKPDRPAAWEPAFEDLLRRLEQLSDQCRDLKEGVQRAIRIADEDPEMALTRARKVLEAVIREVYERRIGEPPGTRPLENLIQRLVKDGYFPDRLDAYATTVRKLGNVGTHSFGEKVTAADVYQSLTQLMPILEWYFEVERPQANGQPPEKTRPPEPARGKVDAPSPGPVAVVPKGLRSFDANDADFFLSLLPGPRDKDGLPESIRFWKHRVEARDEPTFTVGVLYGPSGCGKSSLLKAGLLPRLAGHILPVYVEATAADTEARLLRGLRKRCPDLAADLDLAGTLSSLRQGLGLALGQKVLVVLDQFEQWLHAQRGEGETDLVHALRQCDGERLQAVVTVRDDFWLAASRFMDALHVELVQGQNMALVDLFDPLHARDVLTAFGRAFGRLGDLTREQETFLDQAVAGLAQDGRVVCVRLALFVDMMKGKPWTPATLKASGGIEGVGVTFLEETFSAPGADPRCRVHQVAARAVLKALLPEAGTGIKGNMQSHFRLLGVSGYFRRPADFEELLRILDGSVRLITPTEPVRDEDGQGSSGSGEKYYQLTHDYLVPSLREWLTRKQKETRRGRAELLLADRAAVWNVRPENRQLPSLIQWFQIQTLTPKKNWTPPQRKMMRKANRYHVVRGFLAAALLALVLGGVYQGRGMLKAYGLQERLLSANTQEVPAIVRDMTPYRWWLDPLLADSLAQAERDHDRLKQLYLRLALLPADAGQRDPLYEQMLDAEPAVVPVLREALAKYQKEWVEPLWAVAEAPEKGKKRQRLRAAAALAHYDPESDRWARVREAVANDLVAEPSVYLGAWLESFRPVRLKLLPPLSRVFHNPKRRETERSQATDVLADYAADQPRELANLLMDADEKQFAVLFPKLRVLAEQGIPLLTTEIDQRLSADAKDDDKEKLAKRQANSAVALLRLNQPSRVWPLLRHGPDPRVRSYLLHRFAPLVQGQTRSCLSATGCE